METNEIELLSVGVDVGSSTSHLVFSNLLLRRDERSASKRFLIEERNIIFEGKIIDTPLVNQQTIDINKLTKFLKAEYRRAGIAPGDVQTGAVIITGETAKKANAGQIVTALSQDAGKFVAASAGPNFESVIAAMGSGARARSRRRGETLLSCDIGGGTSNMAIIKNGKIISTSCVSVGGRLIAFDAKGKIRRINEPARQVMDDLGLKFKIGDQPRAVDLDKIAAKLAAVLMEVLTGPATSPLSRKLMVTDDLAFPGHIDAYAFSGGVAELIYGGNGCHNDIGKLLADKINALINQLDSPVLEPTNKIRATVIGAGAHSLSISGSSGFTDNRITFPMKNIPVIRVDVDRSKLSIPHVVTKIREAFGRFDLEEGQETVALYFWDPVKNSYPQVELFAKSVEAALPRSMAANIPIILVFKGDIACSVGNVIRRETTLKSNLLTLDELDLIEGDWIDIGNPLVEDQVFPVTVKSLVFHGC
jgi:ethanolamine utilization protein EutA